LPLGITESSLGKCVYAVQSEKKLTVSDKRSESGRNFRIFFSGGGAARKERIPKMRLINARRLRRLGD